jgi:hypothetical protein
MSQYLFSGFGGGGFGGFVPNVSTMQQVLNYARGGVEHSLPQCSTARAKYQRVVQMAEDALQLPPSQTAQHVEMLRDLLTEANQIHATCRAKVEGKTVAQVSQEPPPPEKKPASTPGPTPPGPTPPEKTNWLLWGGLAFGAVYLMKKGKKKRTKRNPLSQIQRAQRAKRRRRARSGTARTKAGMWRQLSFPQRRVLLNLYGSYRSVPFYAISDVYFHGLR